MCSDLLGRHGANRAKRRCRDWKKLRDKFAPQGLEIVSVSVDADKDAAQRYIAQHGYDWPQVYEPGALDSEPAVQYGIISLPYLMLIDTEGRVVNRNLQYNQLEIEVEKALAKKIASKR